MCVSLPGEPDAVHEAEHLQRFPHQHGHFGGGPAGAGRQRRGNVIVSVLTSKFSAETFFLSGERRRLFPQEDEEEKEEEPLEPKQKKRKQ